MNRVRTLVAADRLSAELLVDTGSPCEPAELRAVLTAAGVVHGIDEAALATLAAQLADPQFRGRATVARGTSPRPGCDGRIALEFSAAPLPGTADGVDRLDYRERAFLHPAAEGAQIARIVPPQPGTPGCDVLGRPLPAPPVKTATLRIGPGALLQPDGRVLALRDGIITTPSGAIDVTPLYEHRGDVDLHSGNLHSHGSLLVGGDVAAGFTVEADGEVQIAGASFGGRISAGGNLQIGLGAQAGSHVEAGGDLRCRHATNSTLRANGTLHTGDQLVHCDVAVVAIELLEGRGHALGGTLRARQHIDALAAGSAIAVPTLLSVADLTSERTELVRRTRQAERYERRAQKAGDRAAGPQKGGKLGRLLVAADDAARTEKLELARRLRELLAQALVRVRGTAHAGVRVQFGSVVRDLQADHHRVLFRWDAEAGTIVQQEAT